MLTYNIITKRSNQQVDFRRHFPRLYELPPFICPELYNKMGFLCSQFWPIDIFIVEGCTSSEEYRISPQSDRGLKFCEHL